MAAALGLLAAALALGPPSPELLARLERAARGATTLSARFEQRKRLRLFHDELRSTGRLLLRRPRHLRWEYDPPDVSVFVVDGQRAQLSVGGAPADRFDLAADAGMRAVVDQVFLWLGDGALASATRQYELEGREAAAGALLVLRPRVGTALARSVTRVELRFDRADQLVAITVEERSGDRTELHLRDVRRGAPIPDAAFRLP